MNQRRSKTRSLILVSLAAGVITLLNACSSKVVVIDRQSDLVRLGSDVSGHVYTLQNGQWVRSSNKVQLPEGWFAGPGPD